ncbi:Ig-like domain-containing protein, partial [Ralstonia pseudosolanacearum]
GTAEANSTINVFDGTTLLGTTTADASGNWTFTPTTALIDGSHSLTATATDAAGNVSTASSAFTLTVDTAAPATPVIGTVTDAVAPVTGTITAGGSTNDANPTLTGIAEGNSTVSIFDGTTLLGTTTADASGNWSYTPTTALTDGSHSLTATATDAAGNVSPASSAFTLTVDTAAPAAPVIGTVTDDVAPITGTVAAGGSTNDTTPTLAGTAEANSTINVFDGTTLLGTTTADASGNWT